MTVSHPAHTVTARPRVSVVIPTYQRRDLVAQALHSVLAQTLRDFEVLVIDDGSTDDTAKTLRTEFDGDRRVRIFEKPNGGTASARNLGLAEARGRHVAFLDSDDVWQPGYLRSQVAAVEHARADAVLGNARYEEGNPYGATQFEDSRFVAPTSLDAMIAGAWGLPSALVVHTEIARGLRFDAHYRYGEDSEFLFRFHAAGYRLVLNPDTLATWRRPATGRKTQERGLHHLLNDVRMLHPHRHDARARKRMRALVYAMHRAVSNDLIRQGLWYEARPHLAHCLRRHPERPRTWLRWLRTIRARPTSGALLEATRARLRRLEHASALLWAD